MDQSRYLAAIFVLVSVLLCPTLCNYKGIDREKCESRIGLPFRPHSEQRHYVRALRDEMKMRSSVQGSHIDAYIVTNWDEHLNQDIGDYDKRLQFISGFTGKVGLVVITLKSVALWTDERYFIQANYELDCDWKIFAINNGTSFTDFLVSELSQGARVGGDPHTVPHNIWTKWESELYVKYIRLIRLNQNLVDCVWKDRPEPNTNVVQVHPLEYAGEKWETKIHTIREKLLSDRCDAIVITSLTEIAYLLNLRGDDVPYTPVFKAYLVVSHTDIYLYANKAKIDVGIKLHLNSQCLPDISTDCVRIKNYDEIWIDLRSYSHIWRKVLVPSHCVHDLGVSEAVYSSIIRNVILEKPSPVIFMRAKKNMVEREGMHRAHILDGAALCDAFSLLERRYLNTETITEMSASNDVDRARYSMKSNRGIAFKTIVAFGPHSALPHYDTLNDTNILLSHKDPCIIDSGGQYAEGTAEATRTLHFSEPTSEQIQMYTNVLRGIIRLSTLVFPENLKPAEIDALARSPVWDSHSDYPQSSGHGIGSFLSVRESPIEVSHTEPYKFVFEEGYFFSNEPGMYKKGRYGIRIKNVLEVYDTGERHPSGARFLGFRDISLVPFEPNMIDRGLLSLQEKRWLNEYNARIRTLVGDELKAQMNMQAFYWMMNKTVHVIEYYPESEYRKRTNSADSPVQSRWLSIIAILSLSIHLIFPH